MSSIREIMVISEYLRTEIATVVNAEVGHAGPVTVGPPDKARGPRKDSQLNLFLYQVVPDAAWRNRDFPRQAKPGEIAPPFLALRLGYLLTAFGSMNNDDVPDDVEAHLLLASAMRRLQDWPTLLRDRPGQPPQDPGESQPEPPRLTLQPLSPDEMAKVWAGLQSPYRLSVAYEVGPVLIESARPTRSAPPVLSRGESPAQPGGGGGADDPGFGAAPAAPPATIRNLVFPPAQAGVRLGDILAIEGDGLDRVNLLEFRHPSLARPIIAAPVYDRAAKRLTFPVPDDPNNWPAGMWTVALLRCPDPGDPDRREFTSASVPFALLPSILLADLAGVMQPPQLVVDRDLQGNITGLSVVLPLYPGPRLDDQLQLAQRVTLFAGAQELPLRGAPGDNAGEVKFTSSDEAHAALLYAQLLGWPGNQPLYVRVRVDGADSSLLKLPFDPAADKREYDPNLVLEVP
jgi:hypothetical protein